MTVKREKSKEYRFIYLSGLPRSGTTWAGQVIANSKKIRYYHEPFHPHRNHKENPFKDFFEYIYKGHPQNEEINRYIDKLCNFSIPKLYDVGDLRNSKKVSLIYQPIDQLTSKLKNQIPLIKDPCSLLMCDWLSNNFNTRIIILLRHPAAFVSSAKKAGWHFGMETFLRQKELMQEYLEPYRILLEKEVKLGTDFRLENSLLFWQVFHTILAQWKVKNKDWYFVKHESLSISPMEEFRKIFDFLDEDFSPKIRKSIETSTQVKAGEKENRLKRDAKKNSKAWKNMLSKKEIEYIKVSSKREWENFYCEEDW